MGCRGRSFIHNNSTQVEVFLQIFTGSGINGIQNLEINAYCSALHYTVFVFILVRKWKLKSGHHSDENLTLRSERIGYAGFSPDSGSYEFLDSDPAWFYLVLENTE